MIGKELLSKRPVTIPEVYELLGSVEGEPTYEQKISREYAEKVMKADAEKARAKVNALKEMGIDEEIAVKLVNVWPKDISDVHLVLAKEEVPPEKYEEILKVFLE